jgi:hypothetical protein
MEITNKIDENQNLERRKFENVRYVYAFITFRTIEAA